MNTRTASLASLRVLSLGKALQSKPNCRADTTLDGGGIRGISSLLILENIMENIRKAEHLGRVPRPCEYFDLIGGTSTGG